MPKEKKPTLIGATDLGYFEPQPPGVLEAFARSAAEYEQLSFGRKTKEDSPIAEFDYREGRWRAGRYIGQADIQVGDAPYRIVIAPRFGTISLFRMLEEILHFRLVGSFHDVKCQPIGELIKLLIGYIWCQKLAKANMHGLPKNQSRRIKISPAKKGRLLVKPTSIRMHQNQLVSEYHEKDYDDIIASILAQAYAILKRDYHLHAGTMPANAADVVAHLVSRQCRRSKRLSAYEYKAIRYSSIYESYAEVVDLSWNIIQKKGLASTQRAAGKNAFSFFVDMAEIWELYIKSLIRKHFRPSGWTITDEELGTYPGKNFQRRLIPDIVMRKGRAAVVLDAKYKAMTYSHIDYDREDYFQLHTYMYYLSQESDLCAGGLLYPLSRAMDESRRLGNTSSTLFGKDGNSTGYFIDGLDLSELNITDTEQNQMEYLKVKETEFLQRLGMLATNCAVR